ncbi:VanZ family protein [Vibrio sp. 404]|uniref:VanZ family protein n=1 Tax=Vibrio marinisediminis TaxID=2758441 RepID=A0A7W2FNW8_9VIBR|nr:VanZ family protein [Vibrio marinisediminis]MBA5761552.1 VanZ family protein [Vibrio marinisediminis]
MHRSSLFFNRRVSVLFLLVLIGGTASLAKSLNYHGNVVHQVETLLGGAWVLHVVLSISLGFVAHWATPRYYFRNTHFRFPPLLVVILVAVIVDEVLQAFIPRREFSIIDLAINISGLMLGAVLHRLWLKKSGV